jgi:regulator of replication initiation timing
MIRQNFSNDKVDDVSAMMDSVSKTISTLSTSISSVLKENNRLHNEKIMPSPNLAEMITATIKEQLSIEFNLSKGQRLPNKDSISKIIMNVQMTYPHVNEEYIVKKCLAMIESMSLQE